MTPNLTLNLGETFGELTLKVMERERKRERERERERFCLHHYSQKINNFSFLEKMSRKRDNLVKEDKYLRCHKIMKITAKD